MLYELRILGHTSLFILISYSVRLLNLASSSLVAQSLYYYLVSRLYLITTLSHLYHQVPHFGSLLPLNSVTM